MQKGNIGVTTENIFPVIKKFLYSDHEIFLREMVSNAVDATQKLKTLAEKGEMKGELGDTAVRISLDSDKGTITISDHGIGMTEEEIDKYINQIAFSGVTDFLEKYKDNANNIIGHFGLGFYSSFMVAKRVDIVTRSYKEGAKAVKWTCDGTPAYEITDSERDDHGSDIILYIDDDCKEYLDKYKIEQLLQKYCKFMPVPIVFGKKQEWKDGKQQDTDEDNVINNVEPLWAKAPSTISEEDYKKFYQTLYPMHDEPLFWIHLNVDYPFNLTGILYFPKVKSSIELQKDKIQLYCNQVFVTDQVEGIVPEFLTLLHGVIDSPDIPLNVSRSYLQSDREVKKISTYITKKVSDRLKALFNEDRKAYEEKWDNLKLFIDYGILTEEGFYDRAKDFALLKDTEGKFFTYEEYKKLIEASQKDKDDTLVYLYSTNKDEQYSYIKAAQDKGYSVLLLDGQLDVPTIQTLEQKFEKSRFTRVDADIIDRLIPQADEKKSELKDDERDNLSVVFTSQVPKSDKTEYNVVVEALGEGGRPVMITQNEWMRRMKEMSRYQSGMAFYGQMPDSYNLVLNSDHPLIKQVFDGMNTAIGGEADKEKREAAIKEWAAGNEIVHQLIDLALLQNGMLKGEALDKFLNRSIGFIGK